jgi:hypothetical protein
MGFPGSDGFCVYMMWSPTPAASSYTRQLCVRRCSFRLSEQPQPLRKDYFVAQYTPCILAVYASPHPLPVWDARLATGRLARTYPGGTLTRKRPPASPGALRSSRNYCI